MSKWSLLNTITAGLDRPKLGDKKAPNFWPSESAAVITNEYDEPETLGKCRRAIYFRYLYDCYDFYEEKYKHYEPLIERIRTEYIHADKYTQWIWIQGELYEEYCVKQATLQGLHIDAQTPVFLKGPNWTLSGKVDEVIRNPDGLFVATEYKSVYGFNANHVLGTDIQRRNGKMGTPRDSNLMQIGIYDYQIAKKDERFANSRLVYGARDTGRYAEYEITTECRGDDTEHFIYYSGIAPNETTETKSQITIENICCQFQYVQNCIDSGDIPSRDYTHTYSEEQLLIRMERGLLGKIDSERLQKRQIQKEAGKDKLNKLPEAGCWQCRFCSFSNLCYDRNANPINI